MKSIKILIVDDLEIVHPNIDNFLRNFVFTDIQINISSAYNTMQAKHMMNSSKYDLVMLDGDAGDHWGYEIIEDIIKHNEKTLIISNSNDDDFNTKNIEMGAHASINKTYLYEWNDSKKTFRTEKAKMIRELLIKN